MQPSATRRWPPAIQGTEFPGGAVALIQRESRRLRQAPLTWLRRDKELQWILWEDRPDYDRALREIAVR
jgi:hypothetical protein